MWGGGIISHFILQTMAEGANICIDKYWNVIDGLSAYSDANLDVSMLICLHDGAQNYIVAFRRNA